MIYILHFFRAILHCLKIAGIALVFMLPFSIMFLIFFRLKNHLNFNKHLFHYNVDYIFDLRGGYLWKIKVYYKNPLHTLIDKKTYEDEYMIGNEQGKPKSTTEEA